MPKTASLSTADPLPDFVRVAFPYERGGGSIGTSFEDPDDTCDITFEGNWHMAKYFYPGFREHVRTCLKKLAALPPNWDSYGAPKISQRIINAAHTLIDRLPDDVGPRPSVVPMSSGKIQFEWDVGGRAVELEIESSGQIHYLRWDPTHHIEEEGVYSLADIGQSVSLIEWVARSRHA